MNATTYTTTGLSVTITAIESNKHKVLVTYTDTDANEIIGRRFFADADKADEFARACIKHAA